MKKDHALKILMIGLTLGTAWAVRGHFGHEQGAAWAGGISALALIFVAGRREWYGRVLPVALAAAVGWGMTGMISYGLVVGYGMSNNFPNALYGLGMLFVIGALFGLLGGGLTGLSLESSENRRVDWGSLIAQMVAGGVVVYGLLVRQLEWFMTPPRSEAWAFCLGGVFALLWYTARKGFSVTTRVALITGLGTGFGFALGNFLQIVGIVAEIPFNMWNVMEYSIGFFGGIALAYSVFTSEWPGGGHRVGPWENRVSFVLLFLLIPFIVFQQSLTFHLIVERFTAAGEFERPELIGRISTMTALVILIVMALLTGLRLRRARNRFGASEVYFIFVAYLAAYILMGYIIHGAIDGKSASHLHLCTVNLIVILMLARMQGSPFSTRPRVQVDSLKLCKVFVALLLVVAVLSFVAVHLHDGLPGTQDRFTIHSCDFLNY